MKNPHLLGGDFSFIDGVRKAYPLLPWPPFPPPPPLCCSPPPLEGLDPPPPPLLSPPPLPRLGSTLCGIDGRVCGCCDG